LVIIPILSLKGGVGRTTIAINLADLLSNKYKVLLIDTDPQNSIASLLCKKSKNGISEVLIKGVTINDVIIPISIDKNFFIIPTGEYAIKYPITFEELFTKENIEKIIISLKDYEFDFIIIDTASRISKPLNSILAFASFALIIVEPFPANITPLNKFLEYLKNDNFYNYYIIVNKMDLNEISEDFYLLIQSITNNNILETIPRDLKVIEAEGNCMPVNSYDSKSPFISFLKKVREKIEKFFI